MTTKSEILQVIAAIGMSAASALAGSQVQKALDADKMQDCQQENVELRERLYPLPPRPSTGK